MKNISDYKIGDELYRYVTCAGVFRWIVTGRRERAEEVQIEAECQTCSHGWKCSGLLAQNDYGQIVFVHMLNEDEEDRQRHFHAQEELHFWPTAAEAKNEHLRNLVRRNEEEVRKTKDILAAQERRLSELRGLIEDVQP